MTWNESLGSRLRGALGHKVDVSSASCGTNGVMHLLFFVKTHDTFTPMWVGHSAPKAPDPETEIFTSNLNVEI